VLLQHVSVNSHPLVSDSAGDHISHQNRDVWRQRYIHECGSHSLQSAASYGIVFRQIRGILVPQVGEKAGARHYELRHHRVPVLWALLLQRRPAHNMHKP